MENWQQSFFGFRRENGRVGVRNHVLILPVDDISNAAVEMVGHNIKGTLSIPIATDVCNLVLIWNCFSAQLLVQDATQMLRQWL